MKMMKLKYMMSALAGLGLVGGILPNALAAAASAKPSPAAEAKITQAIKAAYPGAVIDGMGSPTLAWSTSIFTAALSRMRPAWPA